MADIGNLVKFGGRIPRKKASGPAPDAGNLVKFTPGPKGTTSLAGEPMAKKSKKFLPAVANPDGRANRT